MRIRLQRRGEAGVTLVLILLFAAMGILALVSVLNWSGNEVAWLQRRLQNQGATGAAEAGTELVLGRMAQDFLQGGSDALDNNLSFYRRLAPEPLRANYTFSAPDGSGDAVAIQRLSSWSYTALTSAMAGLSGRAATYRVGCQATAEGVPPKASATLWQEAQFASVPWFAFGIFYMPDLEFAPSTAWRVTGRVHCNSTIYCQPAGVTLSFADHVTCARDINLTKSPDDPVNRTAGTVSFGRQHVGGVKPLLLSLGTNNSSAFLHELIEPPPGGEDANSALGRQRYYNKADLLIVVGPTNAFACSGAYNGFSTFIPWNLMTAGYGGTKGLPTNGFVNPTVSFYNKREGYYVQAIEVDLRAFLASSNYFVGVLGRPVRTLYVADLRDDWYQQTGVRLINGQTLPANGLTVATPNPLYVKGHYNAPAAYLGTTNTSGTAPASLVCDALTLLSSGWADSRGTRTVKNRPAVSTTVNAAVTTGIVLSDGSYYSGGAENAIRLLEDWTGDTLTFNGSLVVPYASQVANSPWGTSDVYKPPNRMFNFDPNFLQEAKLPPGTPWLRVMLRTRWTNTLSRVNT